MRRAFTLQMHDAVDASEYTCILCEHSRDVVEYGLICVHPKARANGDLFHLTKPPDWCPLVTELIEQRWARA